MREELYVHKADLMWQIFRLRGFYAEVEVSEENAIM
jgi:hypothetical protein